MGETKYGYGPDAVWTKPGWYLVAAEWHGEEIANMGILGADVPTHDDSYNAVGANGFFGTPAVILVYINKNPHQSSVRVTHSFGHPWPERVIAGPIRDFDDLQVELEALRKYRAQQVMRKAAQAMLNAERAVESKAQFPWRKKT